MTCYDVFNGDADGICSLIQLRLDQPNTAAKLITGVKRDIKLLQQVEPTATDEVNVLDISMDKNSEDLERILSIGTTVFYADHHYAGEIPSASNLDAHINPNADVCTAMIINGLLHDSHILWAITGAFGDNLNQSALAMAKRTELSNEEIATLKNLGILINYNGYGASLDDLHCTPSGLYQELVQYENPLDFCVATNPTFTKLNDGYLTDLAKVEALQPIINSDVSGIYLLPNEAWARRVSGIFSNQLANNSPDKAHAVITLKQNANYLVSVRAPLNNKSGADEFCRQYTSGGGRSAAAGINDLPAAELQSMTEAFELFYRERL